MKINLNGMDISARGMSIQRRKMDLISENIANTETTKTDQNVPYKRKFMRVTGDVTVGMSSLDNSIDGGGMRTTNGAHFQGFTESSVPQKGGVNINGNSNIDATEGEMVYLPNHPDATKEGYVQMPNVDIVTEMVDMITATRGFEANLTAFNSAKQIAKDSLDI